jgi:ketosteroid isomerase-like protein
MDGMTAIPLPKDVVAAFDHAVDTGDVAALDAVCHPDLITHSFGPTMPQGIEGMRRFVSNRKAHRSAGGWQHVVVIADGEYVVQFGTRTFDWPGGPFRRFDVPPGPGTRDCAFLFRVRDGLITGRWAIRDDLIMMADLSAVTAARPDEVRHGTVASHRAEPFA